MKPLLFEDLMMQANKWTSGVQKGEQAVQRVSIEDLLKGPVADQNPNNAQAPKILPYPISAAVNYLGDLQTQAINARRMFISALNYPLISETPENRDAVVKIANRLYHIKKEVEIIGRSLENLLNSKKT
jgi:hypothetical protein